MVHVALEGASLGPTVASTAVISYEGTNAPEVRLGGAASESLLGIGELAARTAALGEQVAADKAWVAAEQPTDVGNDLLLSFGLTTPDAVRRGRELLAARRAA